MKELRVFRLIIVLSLVVLLATACSTQSLDHGDAIHDINQNPFKVEGEGTVVMGAVSHSFINPEIGENEEMLPLSYNGGELKIDYTVNASGKAKNIGFLIFVDGIPQPYKINTTEGPYEFLHVIDLEEDDKDTPLTFIFTPVTGKQGDTLSVSITSIYYPAFIPDMKETSTYGNYHATLESQRSLVFTKDTDTINPSDISPNQYLSNVSLYTEPVTTEMLDKELIDLNTLDNRVFTGLYLESDEILDNIQVDDSGILQFNFKIFGHPKVRYQNTFYINHKPVTSKEGSSFETVLTKGNVSFVNVTLDLEKLEDFNTFYVVSVPMNAGDFPDDVVVLEKTPSILLYK